MNIGKSVRLALILQDHDQKWLIEKLQLSQSRVSKIVNSEDVSAATQRRLAEAFQMTVSELIALGEEKDPTVVRKNIRVDV